MCFNDSITFVVPCEADCDENCMKNEENHKISACKDSMCKESPYFQAMFFGGFSERSQSEIKLAGVTFTSLQIIVDFCKGCKIPFNRFELDLIFQLLEDSRMLQVINLQIQCADFLAKHMNSVNVIDILSISEHLAIEDLYSKTVAFILWNFKEVSQSKSFSKLSWKSLNMIMKSPHLNIQDQTIVNDCKEYWSKNNFDDFTKISISSENDRQLPLYPSCIGRYKKLPYVFTFDPETLKLDPYLSLADKVTSQGVTANGFQAGSTGTCLYTFGGEFSFGRGNWNTAVWKYDTISENWTKIMTLGIPPLGTPRRHHSMAFDANLFYILGGFGKHRLKLDLVDVFVENNLKQKGLKACQSLPESLYSIATCCHEGKLYAFDSQISALVYDPALDKWEKAFEHVEFPPEMKIKTVLFHEQKVFLTSSHGYSLYSFPMLPEKSEGKSAVTKIGDFQQETQNVCLVNSVIYNFSSDQFAYFSSIESYDIEDNTFDMLFKTEDEDMDFSPYFSFGCFPLVKYPFMKINHETKLERLSDKSSSSEKT